VIVPATFPLQKNKLWRTVPQLVASIHIIKDGTKSLFVAAEYAALRVRVSAGVLA
jgi:hypothetical protein